jgi:hypothetical protein
VNFTTPQQVLPCLQGEKVIIEPSLMTLITSDINKPTSTIVPKLTEPIEAGDNIVCITGWKLLILEGLMGYFVVG